MSISSRELIGPASGRTAQPAQPAKTPSGKPPAAIHLKALAGKVDMPVSLRLRVKNKMQETKETVQAKVDEARQHLHKSTETLQDKASGAKSLSSQALAKIPAPMAGRVEGLREMVRQRPVPPFGDMLRQLRTEAGLPQSEPTR